MQKDTQKSRKPLTSKTATFRDPAIARTYADRCRKPHVVVMGDFPWFWVVSPAEAARLVRGGYEILPR